jgi:predicted Zn-dependent peptidase
MIDERRRSARWRGALLWASLLPLSTVSLEAAPDLAAQVPVDTIQLDNGMTLLLVERPEMTTVAAGWVVEVGSADEVSGRTGLSHLLEHLMFKGTRTIGTRDIEKEMVLLDQEDRLQSELRELESELMEAGTKRRAKLEQRIADSRTELRLIQAEARSQTPLGQFSLFYSSLGAVGLNAHTLRDLTFYYVTIPAEKLEAWFWLESDRMLEPVFREFYKELDVIHEERRLRIESNPTGSVDEQLKSAFWGQHPYAWDPQGAPQELDELTRDSARLFFEQHYRPERITVALVGAFDPDRVRRLAERYFGRIPPREASPRGTAPPPVPAESESERTLNLECRCPSQVQVLYPSAAFGEAESRVLEVLAAVLNGRSGRLYRSMVLGKQIAFSASALQSQLRQAGYFSFRAETKADSRHEDLLAAWDQEVARLQTELVTAEELLRAKNRLTADSFRRLKDPASLLVQLLVYQGMGDWREINSWPRQVLRVEAEQLRAATKRYLDAGNRTVAFYRRTDADNGQSVSGREGAEGSAP